MSPGEYLTRAEELERLARSAASESVKAALLASAALWREMALSQREKPRQSQSE